MKYILIIGDGMADNALSELDGKTPLEYAKTPFMDALAHAGMSGTVRTVPKRVPAGTDTAVLSILSCDPSSHYSGRAPMEAAAMGITMKSGDVAYRLNMVTLEDADKPYNKLKILSHSAGGIDGETSNLLIRDLLEYPTFKEAARAAGMTVYPGGSFRHIAVRLVESSGGHKIFDDAVLTPPHDYIGKVIGPYLPSDNILSALMSIAYDFLSKHPINKQRSAEGKLPANGIWFWANGVATALPSFCVKFGKTASMISAVPLCRGIGSLMGFYVIDVPGATGDLHTNYEGKVDAAVKTLQKHDFVTIHIEAPDECTHDGDLKGKLQAIEWIDSRVVGPLVKKLEEDGVEYRILILSDHKTLMSTRGHNGDPVPFLLYDSRTGKVSIDATTNGIGETGCFCEKTAKKGNFLGDGTRLMSILFEEEDAF